MPLQGCSRNIWWLVSDLGKEANLSKLASEDLPEEIPDLVAEILAKAVEQRQRANSVSASRSEKGSRLPCARAQVITSPRAAIAGQRPVACRFEELPSTAILVPKRLVRGACNPTLAWSRPDQQ